MVVPTITLARGAWTPRPASGCAGAVLGLLLVDGVLSRSVRFDGVECPELLGAGDVFRSWDGAEVTSLAHDAVWRALTPATVALLGPQVAAAVGRWPAFGAALFGRAEQRARRAALRTAIIGTRRAEDRLHLLLWHLAERWGRVVPEGVVLPLALTHRVLAQLACVRRPTASTALGQLARDDRVRRLPDGAWLLLGGPPDLPVPPDAPDTGRSVVP